MLKKAFDPKDYIIPKEWLIKVKDIREKSKGEKSPEILMENRKRQIEEKTQTRVIESPGLFMKNLKDIMDYANKMGNPMVHGLNTAMAELDNNIRLKARKSEPVELTEDVQKNILEKAKNLNSVELLSMFSDLFMENYRRKASIVDYLRKISKSLRNK